jgi:uncharacterized protein (DUF433 family)
MLPQTKTDATPTDPAGAPAYSLAEAAHFIKLPVATLRSWVVGRPYPTKGGTRGFKPLIEPARRKPPQLSFQNLVEAHVLRSLRTEHGVSLKDVRKALAFAEDRLRIDRLLLDRRLCADAGRLFLDEYGKLIELSASGQLAMRTVFEQHLRRIDWSDAGLVARLHPFLASSAAIDARPIAIDPKIAFGRPIVSRKSISTRAIADRLDAGESVEDLADDYELQPEEIEQAVLYECAA